MTNYTIAIKPYGLLLDYNVTNVSYGGIRSQTFVLFDNVRAIHLSTKGHLSIYDHGFGDQSRYQSYSITYDEQLSINIQAAFAKYMDEKYERTVASTKALVSIDESLKALQEQIELAPGNQEFLEAQDRQINSVGIRK
jgi:hypothetical protein